MKHHLLLVNASDEKNLPKVMEIKNLNIQLTLIGSSYPDWIKPYVDTYIKCDLKNQAATISALEAYCTKQSFHGAITFWDREVEITAAITNHFNLPGPELGAIRNAKNKLSMRNMLIEKGVNQAKYYPVSTLTDLENAAMTLGYPFIFKPVAASASAGVFKITARSQIQEFYNSVASLSKPDYWLYPDSYMAEEFMQGNEVSVEGVINQGKVYIAGITQKWKTENHFVEWQHCFPATLDEKIEKDIIRYTEQSLAAIGLNNIAFHVELIEHQGEIKMVEINARMGGDFITSYLLPLCGVNIAKAAIHTALGMKCQIDKPNNYACVRFLLTDKEGTVTAISATPSQDETIKTFALLKDINDSVSLPPVKFADNRLCYVITQDAKFDDCIDSAKSFLDNIKYTIEKSA